MAISHNIDQALDQIGYSTNDTSGGYQKIVRICLHHHLHPYFHQ